MRRPLFPTAGSARRLICPSTHSPSLAAGVKLRFRPDEKGVSTPQSLIFSECIEESRERLMIGVNGYVRCDLVADSNLQLGHFLSLDISAPCYRKMPRTLLS